ncbi:restriction endonuclease subunit S, partial [Ornithobacterium rhinotracheale]|uniref:restriction endonuclease subunit S n=1 Tax=Ornithobacterium rhinotracheale TaxID=28251 RepID=UPI001FF26117
MSTGLKKYSQYKDSGVEWLGQIPAHWEFIKLKYCSDIFNGNSLNDNLKNKFQSFEEEGLAYISSKDINLNTSEINYESGLRIPFNEKKYKIAPKNSILLCIEGGSAGRKIAFTNQNVCFVNKLACLHSKKNMISKYLFYTSRASIFTEQFFLALTGLIGGVSISNISNFVVPLPPLEEQQAIADFLDRKTQQIERVIAQKEKMIALLKERKQIIIQQAVTKGLNPDVPLKDSGVEWLGEIPAHWEVKKLKFCTEINKNSLDENTKSNLPIKYVDIGSVSFENGIEKVENYTFANSPSRARRIAKINNIIVSTVRTYLKAITLVKEEFSDCVFSTGFAILECKNMLNSYFLSFFVKSDAFTKQVDLSSKGMSYPAINSTDLSNL